MRKSDVNNTIKCVKDFFLSVGKDSDFDNFCTLLFFQFFADLFSKTDGDKQKTEAVVSSLALTMDSNFRALED